MSKLKSLILHPYRTLSHASLYFFCTPIGYALAQNAEVPKWAETVANEAGIVEAGVKWIGRIACGVFLLIFGVQVQAGAKQPKDCLGWVYGAVFCLASGEVAGRVFGGLGP